MIVIDYEKCIGCQKCINDCVNQYLLKNDSVESVNYNKPQFAERGRCLKCGHCSAICPMGTIHVEKVDNENIETDDLLTLMKTKRTIRHYQKGAVISQTEVEKIIMAGQSAPTDRNRKSARIILIKEHLPEIYNIAVDYLVEKVKKNGTIDPLYKSTMYLDAHRETVLWNAEYLVIFVGTSAMFTDSVIAAERMQLEAAFLEVGTAYRGDMKIAINNVTQLQDKLNIKKSEEVLIAFAMGKTDMKYIRPAVKINRKVEYM